MDMNRKVIRPVISGAVAYTATRYLYGGGGTLDVGPMSVSAPMAIGVSVGVSSAIAEQLKDLIDSSAQGDATKRFEDSLLAYGLTGASTVALMHYGVREVNGMMAAAQLAAIGAGSEFVGGQAWKLAGPYFSPIESIIQEVAEEASAII